MGRVFEVAQHADQGGQTPLRQVRHQAFQRVRRVGREVRLIGHAEKVEDETAAARRVMALTPEERMGWLRQSRRLSNEVGGVFGLGPAVAGNLQIQRATVKPGHEVCLVSDGLYRLISPYATVFS